MPILSFILWTPLLGALLVACIPPSRRGLIRGIAYAASGLPVLGSGSLLALFDRTDPSPQWVEAQVWNPELGSYYALAIDGYSLPLLLLSSLLALVALQGSAPIVTKVKSYHVWFLALQFGMTGVFLAADWSLFFVFWEATLTPLFFLIDQWGGRRRHAASLNFVLYTLGGSVFMLVSLLTIFTSSPEHSTGMQAMLRAAQALPPDRQTWLLLGLLIGFGVKMPVFPLHGWLPLVHVEAPGPISILLSGALLKMGAYGLLKAVTMLPHGALLFQPWLAALGFTGLIYGGLLAFRQTDLKALIAYSSIGHMGVVMLGIATLNGMGLQGAVLEMIAHGLAAGALFLLAGIAYERTQTREIARYRHQVQFAPAFALLLALALLAGMGLPGFGGFVAELEVLVGGYQAFGPVIALLGLGVLVGGIYTMCTLRALLTGPGLAKAPLLAAPWPATASAALLVGGLTLLGLAPGIVSGLTASKVAETARILAAASATAGPARSPTGQAAAVLSR